MNIIQAIQDQNLFRHFLGEDLSSWRQWMTALRVLYGGPVRSREGRELIAQCTGRVASRLPREGFDTALFLVGRRSGKSRTSAVVGAFEAVLAGHEKKLAKGETGVVPIISPSKSQSRIVHGYLRSIFNTPLLQHEVERDTREGFELRNGTRIEILAGDYRLIRGFTLLAAIIDEVCFFGVEDTKIKSDTELIRAIKPSLATVGGKLVAISSPYARRGWSYQQWKRHHGKDDSDVLVWNCPSRTMNPTLPKRVVDRAIAEDMQAAKSEYLGEFRDDVAAFIPREVVESLTRSRKALFPEADTRYVAFADLSGGRADDAAIAIAHKEGRDVVVDKLCRYRPPFNPPRIVALMCEELKSYRVSKVIGDNYAAEFVASAFTANGVRYEKASMNKSQLYLELLPRLCSGEIELPNDQVLVEQLASLERRTRSGGRDTIDHPPGGHDDLANVVAGVSVVAAAKPIRVGAFARPDRQRYLQAY